MPLLFRISSYRAENGTSMRIGKRLQQLNQMITGNYRHIWDCCCDHGLLGITLLQRNAATHIHFVDVVPQLMQSLSERLQQHTDAKPPESAALSAQWHTHCIDVAQLPLHQFAGRQLIVIAGVGGDLTAQLVNDISAAYPHIELEFLLCPVRQQFLLRQQLITLQCELIDEVLVSENQRFYEVLHVLKPRARMGNTATREPATNTPSECVAQQHHSARTTKGLVHTTGEALWHAKSPEQANHLQAYLNNTVKHFERMSKRFSQPANPEFVDEQEEQLKALAAYQKIQISKKL